MYFQTDVNASYFVSSSLLAIIFIALSGSNLLQKNELQDKIDSDVSFSPAINESTAFRPCAAKRSTISVHVSLSAYCPPQG